MSDLQNQWKRKKQYLRVDLWGNPAVSVTQAVGPFYGIKAFTGTVLGTPIEGWWIPPADLDVTKPIGVRVHFTVSGTTCSDALFIVLYDLKPAESDVAADILEATADTALDTAIANKTWTFTELNVNQWTSRGIINGNKFTEAQLIAGLFLQFSVELDAATGNDTSNAVFILGIEFDYAVKACKGAPSHVDQGLSSAF